MLSLWCLCVFVLVGTALSAPKGSKSKTNYDQKQTGDYNIRLNLKDFQIVAFIDNDSLGDLGSYDYNYDYSELTVKPGSVSTPSSTEQTSPVSTASDTESKPTSIKTTEKPVLIVKPHSTSENPASSTQKPTTTSAVTKTSTTNVAQEKPTTEVSIQSFPDKIPVFVQPPVFLKDGIADKKPDAPVTNISIVPSEDMGQETVSPQAPLGEIMYYRKCAQGYARDKRGRCRKIRRPQFPFGIARFASNLASKFKPTELEDSEQTTFRTSER